MDHVDEILPAGIFTCYSISQPIFTNLRFSHFLMLLGMLKVMPEHVPECIPDVKTVCAASGPKQLSSSAREKAGSLVDRNTQIGRAKMVVIDGDYDGLLQLNPRRRLQFRESFVAESWIPLMFFLRH